MVSMVTLNSFEVISSTVPRRKYGRMVKPFKAVPQEKCRLCRLKIYCPEHKNKV